MLRRVAAYCFAACLVVWPARSGSDTDTFWSSPSAAVLAAASRAEPVRAESTDAGAAELGKQAESDERASAGSRLALAEAELPAKDSTADGLAAKDLQGHAAAALAAIEPIPPVGPATADALPFGLAAMPVSSGDIWTKWTGVEAAIQADDRILTRCRAAAQPCPRAARNFLAIVAQGRGESGLARIGVINRAVNMAIEPMSDMAQWGVPDRWSPPLETFSTGRGDCEDYAIAKYVALIAAGVPADDVKLVVVRNTAADQEHAIVAVRNGSDWIALDNRWLMLVKDVDMPKTIPLYVLDAAGVRQFAAPAMAAAGRRLAPASIGF